MGHDAPAAQDQEIGDGFAEPGPLGDGEHMIAPLGGRDRDEVLIGEARRLHQDGTRHGDLVEGELADDAARRVRHRRDPLRQFDAGAQLDGARQPPDHHVEDADLLFVHMDGCGQEQVRQPRQDVGAHVVRAAQHRGFEISQQRADRTHT